MARVYVVSCLTCVSHLLSATPIGSGNEPTSSPTWRFELYEPYTATAIKVAPMPNHLPCFPGIGARAWRGATGYY